MAGVRVATVSTVALVTVGVVVGYGGLGGLILRGFQNNFYRAEIMTASVLTVALGLTFDVLLAGRDPADDAVGEEAVVSRRRGRGGADEHARRRHRLAQRPAELEGKTGVPYLTYEHLYISGFAVLLAAVVALPLALALGHTGRGGGFTVVVSNVSRAIPTLALLTIFAATAIGFGNRATIIALAVFAIPPLLTNAYVGVREVDRDVVEAARGMGMSGRSVLLRVELPLAVPLIAAGFRTASVQVVATATLAALVGGGGLGRIITDGFGQQDRPQILAGGILVAPAGAGHRGHAGPGAAQRHARAPAAARAARPERGCGRPPTPPERGVPRRGFVTRP